MLKIYYAKVGGRHTAHTSITGAKKWCEKDAHHPKPEHAVCWNGVLELRDAVTGFWLAEITPMRVIEPEEEYTGEVIYLNVKYPFEKLEKDMLASFNGRDGPLRISFLYGERIHTAERVFMYYQYEYTIVTLDDAIRLEDDPIKKLAYRALRGDPMATDAIRDTLKF